MYIKNLTLSNFKCFSGKHNFDFCIPDGETTGSGLNVFVGENNSGKSSVMEAIYFVRNKVKNNIRSLNANEGDEFSAAMTFTGDISNVVENFIQDNKKEVFKKRIYKEDGKEFFTVKRTYPDDEELKKILFLNKETGEFKNESGIDGPFQAFFQISNIWAKTNPEKEGKYGASTVCGNLLSEISEKFKIDHREQYQKFLKIFTETFNDDKAGLQADLNEVASETEQILAEQFGEAKLRFRFDNPEPDILFSNVKIFVKDGGPETELFEKGHGMQRAVILSLLQVYAKRITEIENEKGEIKLKPHFLFIDEPEMGLHPQAQKKLFDALKVIAKTHQVFISTHSENFIPIDAISNIFRFHKDKIGVVSVYDGKKLNIDLKVNRKFFLHHHKLFFTDKAIFVEGAEDLERYSKYLHDKNSSLKKDLYFLGGCGDYSIFKDLCDGFGIKSCFVFDLDVIHKNSTIFNKYIDIKSAITLLDKEVVPQVPKDGRSGYLLDSKLTDEEKKIKDKIISDLAKYSLYVLPNGAVENYLDVNGDVIGSEAELEIIFGNIQKI